MHDAIIIVNSAGVAEIIPRRCVMARKRISRFNRNVNRAQKAHRTAKKVERVVRGNVRGIRRRLRRPGSGLAQYFSKR